MKIIACQNVLAVAEEELASTRAVVMDEESYQKIGSPSWLGGAAKIVLSSNRKYPAPGCYVMEGMGDAIRFAISAGIEMMLVIAGDAVRHTAITAYHAEMR